MEDGNNIWIGKGVKVVKKDGHIKSGRCIAKDSMTITLVLVSGRLELISLDTVERINVLEGGIDGRWQRK